MTRMANKQLVSPRTGTTDFPGACLRFSQTFYGAPAKHRSARHAWDALPEKFGPDVPVPMDVSVLLWYDHWGEYDDGQGQYGPDPSRPYWGNWGHVTPFVPGDAIYSSPSTPLGSPRGQERYASIAQVEQRFSATYLGWSPVINGLWVAEIVPPTITQILEDTMSNPIVNITPRNAIMIGTDSGEFVEYATPKAMNSRGIISTAFFGSGGGDTDKIPSMSEGDFAVIRTVWRQMCSGSGIAATVDMDAVKRAIEDAIKSQGVSVDTTAIAKAVEATLQDEFASVPKKTVDELKERL